MKIFLTDQKNNLKKHLQYLLSVPVMSYEKAQMKKKETVIDISTPKRIDELNLDFFFDYRIFPANIMTFLTQWHDEGRSIQVGDTIVQQVYLPPLRSLSAKIVFGVRINELIDEPKRKGFSYETLDGHVEQGESTFTIEEVSGKLISKIETHSRPALLAARLVGPIVTLPYQAFCTKKALENIKDQIESHDPLQ